MTEAFASDRQTQAARAFLVKAPRAGDVLSGALHTAYDQHSTLPGEFTTLLAQLDRLDRR